MAKAPAPRWWEVRRAQNLKPATYRCPLCGEHLPALSEHMLIVPEGDSRRRRHAHAACVLAARRAGRLPTQDEWRRSERSERSERSAGSRRPARTPGSGAPDAEIGSGPWARLRDRLAGRRAGG